MNPCYCMARAAMGAYVKILALGKFRYSMSPLNDVFCELCQESCMSQEICELYCCGNFRVSRQRSECQCRLVSLSLYVCYKCLFLECNSNFN